MKAIKTSATSILTDEVQAKLKQWKVKLRSEPQTVHHRTYGFSTILSPAQFACYEGAIKAIYTSWFISSGNPIATMIYHQSIADPNNITLPYIPNKYFT